MESPQSPTTTGINLAVAYRKRLALVAFALITAQVLYLLLGLMMLTNGFKPPSQGLPRVPFTLIALVAAIVTPAVSFLVVKLMAGRQPASTDPMSQKLALQKQFFTGFALSTSASVIGLLLFFLFADLKSLAFLVCVAVAAIFIHYQRIKRAVEEIDRAAS